MAVFELGSFSLGTLIGIAIGAFLGHALATRRERSKVLWQAASDFRDAFVVARKRIEVGDHEVGVIADQFAAHQDARLKYADYLSGRRARRFIEDWNKYKEWHTVMCGRSPAQVLYESDDPRYVEQTAIRATTLIERLLRHARP